MIPIVEIRDQKTEAQRECLYLAENQAAQLRWSNLTPKTLKTLPVALKQCVTEEPVIKM